jgi:hypothetical protein
MRELREKRIVVKSGDEIVHDLPLEEFLQLPRTDLIDAVMAATKGHVGELEDYCQRTDTDITITDQLRADITDEERREIEKQESSFTIEMPTITNPGGIERQGILVTHFPKNLVVSIEGWKYRRDDRIEFEDGEIAQVEMLIHEEKGDYYVLNRKGPPREAVKLDRSDVERTSSKFS